MSNTIGLPPLNKAKVKTYLKQISKSEIRNPKHHTHRSPYPPHF